MKKTKLLFVTASLGYGIGGSEKALIEMLKLLDLSKYDISVLSLNKEPEQPFYFDGIKTTYGDTGFLHISTPLRTVIQNPNMFSLSEIITKSKIALYSRLKKGDISGTLWDWQKKHIPPVEEEYDIVIGYGLALATYFATEKVIAKRRVLWMDSDFALTGLNVAYCRRFYETADRVVVVDQSQIERLCSVYPMLEGKVVAIRNVIPVEEIICKSKKALGFKDKLSNNEKRILSVGRLCEEKKFLFAVDAASILKKKGYSFRWYIIGFGPQEQQLRQRIRDEALENYVVLLGQKTNPYPFFAQTDLYVQTSIFEGSCITIEEAMVFGKPVVSTNFPPAYNKIVEGESGFIVEMNPQAIADGIEKLLRDDELCEHMIRYQHDHPLTYDEIIRDFDMMLESL